MILSSLNLTNFRCYKDFKIDFAPITIFSGPNGIGKTNLIEGVYLLSLGKSYRTNDNLELIRWQEDFCRIKGNVKNDVLELIIDKNSLQKIVKINEVKKKNIELFGKLKTVLFSPETADIVTGAPRLRRRFLDVILSQINREYLCNLIDLQKVIRNRNALLKNIKEKRSTPEELNFWNSKLIELSKPIIKERLKLINYIDGSINPLFSYFKINKGNLKIKYVQSISDLDYFPDLLFKNQEREIAFSSTMFGPHRDDLRFLLDNRDLSQFASRGEIRAVVFSLKMAELNYLKQKDESTLLLLDDIFSELDKIRREKLSEIIKDQPTIITTTDEELIGKELRKKAKIVKLDQLAD
ncbi:hypothetical protein A3F08_00215 [Candidatus Berkelbacteria bacterium RIFCSPHIGHO2_12_FULL_36_9]|uniref:DNA replication and repair protein RecF n=1 Tax=Candidatus Berkelbacteria bacterium RIFCSPHIGHO2_12_FULL_36_9 TaxID=1797469 RepID=A0A1F5EGR6_9BACT|nr:MAG: hypothetical protein A3F08_00215 [Candidatus Berkelbacteria bacterium RIFCSPHIGHO2_12_FULL_36_9]